MIDILLDENKDLTINNGDIKIGESINQEVELIFLVAPGQLREDGFIGVDIINELLNENVYVRPLIKKMLKRDNKELKSFNILNNNILIEAIDV
ncbi:MAG: hypothetical protein JXA16_01055 [Bacteroidales bacterium]|nr:hypothetical protein [Bacteroidales bacterium]